MADLDTPVRGGSAIGGMLTRKYAGIPAFVILLVVAGGAYLYIRSRGSYAAPSAVTGSGADSGTTDLGSESGYQASGQPQIVFVPAGFGSTTDPNHPNHPAGPGGKHRNSGGPTYTGKGARGYGTGRHGKGPKSTRQRYPVRQPNR